MRKKYAIGVDEVGRGCLAGPVVVCAAIFPIGKRLFDRELGSPKDSKKISATIRRKWFEYFRKAGVRYAIARSTPAVIDRLNISRAANRAAERAVKKLLLCSGISEKAAKIFLDGGLYLGDKNKSLLRGETVKRGDERIKIISAASIIAKVKRDGYMGKLSRRFPGYGLELHKGYGTSAHIGAIRVLGPSEVHRKTFLARLI